MDMTVPYPATSVYANTPQVSQYLNYLDFWQGPSYVPSSGDTPFLVTSTYQNRPDLLSYDLYGTTGYWWIFALRNPDIIKDPIFDLKSGITIYLPVKTSLPKMAN
jgi:hypothetical protein